MSKSIVQLRRLGFYARHPHAGLFRLFRGRALPSVMRRALRFPTRQVLCGQLRQLLRAHSDRHVVVFPTPSCPWSYLFQRPQQLAVALARVGCLVLYGVETHPRFEVDFRVRGLYPVEERLYLYADAEAGASLEDFAYRVVVWQYWPNQRPMIDCHLWGAPQFYDCCDDVTLFAGSHVRRLVQHSISLGQAQRVFASSRELVCDLKPLRPDVVYLPNACDYVHFHNVGQKQIAPLEKLRTAGRPIIGFAGAIAPWVDVELILALAAARPQYDFVLIGEDQIGLAGWRQSKRVGNLHVLPALSYRDLPAALAKFDVSIIPFKENAITKAACPIKLFEYLASGKPVVSTDVPECRVHKPVLIASDAPSFASALDRALELSRDVHFVRRLDKCARANTWTQRAKVILHALDNQPARRSVF